MDESNNNMMSDIDDSATLILNALGCENMKEDVLELDILSHFYQAVATSYGRQTDGVHEALLTLKLIGGDDAKAISADAFKTFICTRFNKQEDAVSRLAAVATTFDFRENNNNNNTMKKTSETLKYLSPKKKSRGKYIDISDNANGNGINSNNNMGNGAFNNVNNLKNNNGNMKSDNDNYNNNVKQKKDNNNNNTVLLSHYQFNNVRNNLERKISRRSSIAELVDRNVLKSPKMSRIDARTASIDLKLRKAKLAKALAKRLVEDEMIAYNIDHNGLVKERKSSLKKLSSPHINNNTRKVPVGNYAEQRDNVNKEGLNVDSVTGGMSRD